MAERLQPLPKPSDESLVERVELQDVAAFSVLYDRHAPAVYALAAHLLSPADAEEITQEVFLRLWNRASQFDPARGYFRAWFMTVARRCVLDKLRRLSLERRVQKASALNVLLSDTLTTLPDVAESAWLRQRQEALLDALRELPDEQRWVITLAYFGGLSHSELAAHLDWPLGTVKKRIRLGMQKLRHQLMPWRELP